MFHHNLLKAAIVRAGFTQGEYARLIGISQNSLTSRMNGDIPFNIDEVDRTRSVLGIDNSEICAIFFSTESLKRENEERSIAE